MSRDPPTQEARCGREKRGSDSVFRRLEGTEAMERRKKISAIVLLAAVCRSGGGGVSDLTAEAGGSGSSQRCVFADGGPRAPFQGSITRPAVRLAYGSALGPRKGRAAHTRIRRTFYAVADFPTATSPSRSSRCAFGATAGAPGGSAFSARNSFNFPRGAFLLSAESGRSPALSNTELKYDEPV
jgi:hypothetical protein